MGRRGDRDVQKERMWRRLVLGQSRSGLSVRAFCEREALKESAFYFWRREIARRDGQAAATPKAPSPRTRAVAGRSTELVARRVRRAFLPVAIGPGSLGASARIEVRLPSGIVLGIGSGVDAATLGMVLKAVRE
jgi:hypothetical protein